MVRPALASLGALLLSGCVLSPDSHSTAPDGQNVEILFQGVTEPTPRTTISIEYELPRGGFATISTVPLNPVGSWLAHVVVPEDAWWKAPCNFATFRVRDSNGLQHIARDQACDDAAIPDPNATCFTGTIVMAKPQTHVGDLALVGGADATLYQCVTDIEGNLSITGDAVPAGPDTFTPGVVFQLPRLEVVSGDLTIDGGRSEVISLPRLEEVGGNMSATVYRFRALVNGSAKGMATRIDGRRLVSIGGSLTYQANSFQTWPNNLTFALGLDALVSVGGGVTLHENVFPSNIQGLGALLAIPGDLVFDAGVSDLNSSDSSATPAVEGLLNSLQEVAGNAQLVLPPNANIALAHLAHVGGDLTVQAAGTHASLRPTLAPALADVGGDLLIHDGEMLFCNGNQAYWPALTSVGGTVLVDGHSSFKKSFGATGAAHLTVGSVQVAQTLTARVPFQSDLAVTGNGAVSFTDNTALCPCLVDAFTTQLAASGWTGAATSTGNGTAAVCAPCPQPASCP
jgi:hypothetical protein